MGLSHLSVQRSVCCCQSISQFGSASRCVLCLSVVPNDKVLLGAHTGLFKCLLVLQINDIFASLSSLTKPPQCVRVVLTALQQMWRIILIFMQPLHYTACSPRDPPSRFVEAVAVRNVPSPPALGTEPCCCFNISGNELSRFSLGQRFRDIFASERAEKWVRHRGTSFHTLGGRLRTGY